MDNALHYKVNGKNCSFHQKFITQESLIKVFKIVSVLGFKQMTFKQGENPTQVVVGEINR